MKTPNTAILTTSDASPPAAALRLETVGDHTVTLQPSDLGPRGPGMWRADLDNWSNWRLESDWRCEVKPGAMAADPLARGC